MRLNDVVRSRNNGFDALRLGAALLVVVGHAWALSGEPQPGIFNRSFSGLGVQIFFAISGALIAMSWERQPSIRRFFTKRALRLFPALIVVVTLTTFVLGPIVTSSSLGNYLTTASTYVYEARNVVLLHGGGLPGVFADNPVADSVNGALWTLIVEVSCYCCVPLAALLLRRRPGITLIVGGIILGALAPTISDQINQAGLPNPDPGIEVRLEAVSTFLVSMGVMYERRAIVMHPLLALAAGLIVILGTEFPNIGNSVGLLALVYVVLWVGFLARWLPSRVFRGTDLSYGVYLIHFPTQQAIVHYTGAHTPVLTLSLSLAIAMPLAAVSWFLIEKPALARKPQSGPIGAEPPQKGDISAA